MGAVATVTLEERGADFAPAAPKERYLHRDHLGSIELITNAAGEEHARHSFDAWGARRNPGTWLPYTDPSEAMKLQGPAGAPLADRDAPYRRGFTGHEELLDLGLVHMNARLYDPVVGRFLSPDPIVQDATDSQTWNAYTYVRNNPLSLTDPSGFGWWGKFWKGVGNAFKSIGRAFKKAFRAIGKAFKKIGKWVLKHAHHLAKIPVIGGIMYHSVSSIGYLLTGNFKGFLIASANIAFEAVKLYAIATGNVPLAVAMGAGQGAFNAAVYGGSASDIFKAAVIDGGRAGLYAAGAGILINAGCEGLVSEVQGGKFIDGFATSLKYAAIYAGLKMTGIGNTVFEVSSKIGGQIVGAVGAVGARINSAAQTLAFNMLYDGQSLAMHLDPFQRGSSYGPGVFGNNSHDRFMRPYVESLGEGYKQGAIEGAKMGLWALATRGVGRVLRPVLRPVLRMFGGGRSGAVLSRTAAARAPEVTFRLGHTFTKHGMGNTPQLLRQAAGSGRPVGQWLNDAAARRFIGSQLGNLQQGARTVNIPQGLGRVVNPNGTFSAATRACLVPSGSGVKTAYPLP